MPRYYKKLQIGRRDKQSSIAKSDFNMKVLNGRLLSEEHIVSHVTRVLNDFYNKNTIARGVGGVVITGLSPERAETVESKLNDVKIADTRGAKKDANVKVIWSGSRIVASVSSSKVGRRYVGKHQITGVLKEMRTPSGMASAKLEKPKLDQYIEPQSETVDIEMAEKSERLARSSDKNAFKESIKEVVSPQLKEISDKISKFDEKLSNVSDKILKIDDASSETNRRMIELHKIYEAHAQILEQRMKSVEEKIDEKIDETNDLLRAILNK